MSRFLVLAMLLTTSYSAKAAETPNAKALREANSYVLTCDIVEPDRVAACKSGVDEFRANYLKAKSGDYSAQMNIVFILGHGENGVGVKTVKQNAVQSCAWLLVMLLGGSPQADASDRALIPSRCGPLDEGGKEMARQRAAALLTEIRTAPTKPPSPPREVPFRGKLDGTAYPLSKSP